VFALPWGTRSRFKVSPGAEREAGIRKTTKGLSAAVKCARNGGHKNHGLRKRKLTLQYQKNGVLGLFGKKRKTEGKIPTTQSWGG